MKRQAKTTIEDVSIPSEYHIPGASLFTPTWWKEVAKTDFFWTQVKKYITPGTINRRIGLEIKIDVVAAAQTKGQAKEEKRSGTKRTASTSVPTMTPMAGEESDVERDDEGTEERQVLVQNQASPAGPRQRRRGRPRRAASVSYVDKFVCVTCGDLTAVLEIEYDGEGNSICKLCKNHGTANTITVEIPSQPMDSHKPFAEPEVSPTPSTIKVEEAEEVEAVEDELSIISSTSRIKRQHDDDGEIRTINGVEWLFYSDNGTSRAVRIDSPAKRIKTELDDE